jgi:hypothetical protein
MKQEETGSTLKVEQHVILKNFWEYYLEAPDENGIAFGFVMGFECELGYVDLNEIAPFAISSVKGTELNGIFPASGWNWVDNS